MVRETLATSLECRPAAGAGTAARTVPSEAVKRMARYTELTGLPLICVAAENGRVVASTDEPGLMILPAVVQHALCEGKEPRIVSVGESVHAALLPLPEIDGAPAFAVGFAFNEPTSCPAELVLVAAESNWSQVQLADWCARQLHCSRDALERLVTMAIRTEELERRDSERDLEFAQLGDQLEQTYEEIALMRALTQRLQISRGSGELAELCLERMHELAGSGGSAIWIAEKDGSPHFHVRGELPFDEIGMARLIANFEGSKWSPPLVRNNLAGTRLGADFPGLRSLIIVPVSEGPRRFGWIVTCNLSGNREFGTVEAGLVNSVAAVLGTHLRNIELYQEHEDLLICFVRSLVSTLDAKDPYTRGHSERVALVAKRLGEVLGLSEQDLDDVYLSGLLHDLGKIGVDDAILRKTDKLTDEEFAHIKQHPMIGYNILSGLKNLQQVLPGVRNHHESWKGGGYPDGLTGENIPLMARILAVADSYDAMKSDRPYRKGMSRDVLENIFRKEAGKQWDTRVIDAYFQIADDAERISRMQHEESA